MNALDDFVSAPKKARVEIIPLIDVIFFLLATFVLFTLTLHRTKVLEADLPKANHGERPTDETTAFIHVSAGGAIQWKVGTQGIMETITPAELEPKLQHYKHSVHAPRILVRSDGHARLREAVVVLDEVHRAEIKQVAIETIATTAAGR